MRTAAVVNPRAATGRAKRAWPALAERLGPVEAYFTKAPGHAIEITRRLLEDGCDRIIAVGGDGTINEVVNGFFDQDQPVCPAASLGILPLGTGGDFRRTLGLAGLEQAMTLLRDGIPRLIDIGKVTYLGHDGVRHTRYFANLVSFGMGGEVASRAKNWLSPVSGKAAFLWATLEVFFRYRPKGVELELDGAAAGAYTITNIAVGNGRYHGGGMHVCPRASLDDGLLEVTVIDALSMFELVRDLPVLYSENLYVHPKTRHLRGRRLAARSPQQVSIEVDGEPLGTLPLEVSVLPRLLPLIASG